MSFDTSSKANLLIFVCLLIIILVFICTYFYCLINSKLQKLRPTLLANHDSIIESLSELHNRNSPDNIVEPDLPKKKENKSANKILKYKSMSTTSNFANTCSKLDTDI